MTWPPRSTARSPPSHEIQRQARAEDQTAVITPRLPQNRSARWPMIVLRSPKGWTGPAVVDGLPVEGTWRAHQSPLAEVRTNPEHPLPPVHLQAVHATARRGNLDPG